MRQQIRQWLPVALILLLLLISLSLLNLATYNTNKTEYFSERQLYLNIFILVVLSSAIFINLVRAFYQWRTRQAGSRFTIRIMVGFLILTVLPALVIAFFSMNFLGSRIDSWFERSVEGALDDSVELSQLSLAIRTRQHLGDLSRIRPLLANKSKWEISDTLERFREETGAHEVMLLDADQRIFSMSVADNDTLIPLFPAKDLFRAFNTENSYYAHLEPVGTDGLFSRVAIALEFGQKSQSGILTALYPISEKERRLTESVENVRSEYKNLSFQRNQFKDAFRLTLLMIMVLTVLFSIWAAFVFSRRLTQPVRILVEGTLAVAAGDLEKKLPVSDKDDFSLLARSFNTMTRRLSDAQNEREQARRQLQQEHDYLNVVLAHLTSGVITLDAEGIIRRTNAAAGTVLQIPMMDWVGQPLASVINQYPHLTFFKTVVCPALNKPETLNQEWQFDITLEHTGKRLILICRGASLPPDLEGKHRAVLVFDDVSNLIQAEHDAAWGEVARRLAHEIKNPLTPIQLSAERLVRKLSNELSPESEQFLKRMSNTIVQQVDNLKAMVNAFSDYARAPRVNLQLSDLNALVQEITELYRLNSQQSKLDLQLDNALPKLKLDVHRIRQLLVNLIKNALEAFEEADMKNGNVTLITRQLPKAVLLEIRDTGPGIPPELLPRLFEPYVTSKHKGTGLGLAIVKKIVDEHNALLSANNSPEKGAIISIRFPLTTEGSKEQK